MKKFAIEIKWGFLLTLAIVASAIVEKEMGLYEKPGFAFYVLSPLCFAPIGLVFYYFFYREKFKVYFKGEMTWQKGFMAGLMMTAIVALLVPIQKNVIHQFIAPELLENTILQKMASGKVTREQAQETTNLTNEIYSGMQLVLSSGVVAAALFSLIFRTKTK